MTRRHVFLGLPALALSCLLLAPEASFAQFRAWRGGGFGGTGYGGFSNFGNGYGTGLGNSWGGYNGYNGYNGYGASPYGWNGWSTGNAYAPVYQGYSVAPANGMIAQPYLGSTGYASVIPSGDYRSFYPSGTLIQNGQVTPIDNSRARIHVQVPANAQVFFDDSPTRQTGAERNFVTPPLEANHRYSYQISARWTDTNGKEQRQNRTVRLSPGQTTDVNFMTNTNANTGDQNQVPRPRTQPEDDGARPLRNQPNVNQNPQNPNPVQPPRKSSSSDTPR